VNRNPLRLRLKLESPEEEVDAFLRYELEEGLDLGKRRVIEKRKTSLKRRQHDRVPGAMGPSGT
jgi:hypothetical protein